MNNFMIMSFPIGHHCHPKKIPCEISYGWRMLDSSELGKKKSKLQHFVAQKEEKKAASHQVAGGNSRNKKHFPFSRTVIKNMLHLEKIQDQS